MAPYPAAPLRFLSLNADSNHKLDSGKGEQSLRGILLAQFLLKYDLVCLMECKWQEQNVLPHLQKGLALESELKAALQPWRCVSQTTAMPSKTCILYNSDRLQLIEDVDVPAEFGRLLDDLGSAGSGLPADSLEDRRRSKELLNRCCAVVLQDQAAPNTSFVALSFHGHHRRVSDPKKCELFRLFARLASAIAASRGLPVVFGGDFNLHLKAFVADLQPAMTASKLAVYENAMTSSKRPFKKLVDAIGVVGPSGQAGTATRAYCGNIGLLRLPSSRAEAEQLLHPATIQRLDEYDAKATQQQRESNARGGKRPQRHIIFWPALEQLMGPAGLFDHDGICAQVALGHNSTLQEAALLQPLPLAASGAAAAAAAEVAAAAAAGAVASGAAAATEAKQRGTRSTAAAQGVKQGAQYMASAADKTPVIEVAVPTAAKPKAAPSTQKAAKPKAASPPAADTNGVGLFIEELRAAAAGAAAAIAAEKQRKRVAKPRAALAVAEE